MQKFENVDILKSLKAIMQTHTEHFQSDFDIDIKTLNFDKESARRSIGQTDTFNVQRACGLIRQNPRQGASDILSANRSGNVETAAAMTRTLV